MKFGCPLLPTATVTDLLLSEADIRGQDVGNHITLVSESVAIDSRLSVLLSHSSAGRHFAVGQKVLYFFLGCNQAV